MKKIYYFPGLISAIIIPILFWYYGNQRIEEARTSVMDIWLPPKLSKDKSNLTSTFEPLRNWNYKKIKVDPNKENSSFYVSEIKALQKRNKKNTGIEFILDKKNTYGDFASLLNDMAIAQQDTYAYDLEKTGHLFAIINYIDPNAKEQKYECLLCNDVIYENEVYKLSFLDEAKKFITNLSKEGYYIILGFLFLLSVSIFSLRERFQLS
ncbi:hypothetical protein [Chryseobacterium polytrichastri]|uniref:Uncharacterized protein n=1 Tax=Chryseobacterium polytrichastri TaxID=1302687 RepID=A0A1M7C3K8_9FLAO|nr:hypothetical protein [Chryseobacterium polytrichastri]SHL61815.1 hypothetical protein SAMN05444267_102137 [Chryseobacterium polytrichastri]